MKYVIKNHVTLVAARHVIAIAGCLRFKLGLLLNLIAYARLTCSVYQGIPRG